MDDNDAAFDVVGALGDEQVRDILRRIADSVEANKSTEFVPDILHEWSLIEDRSGIDVPPFTRKREDDSDLLKRERDALTRMCVLIHEDTGERWSFVGNFGPVPYLSMVKSMTDRDAFDAVRRAAGLEPTDA